LADDAWKGARNLLLNLYADDVQQRRVNVRRDGDRLDRARRLDPGGPFEEGEDQQVSLVNRALVVSASARATDFRCPRNAPFAGTLLLQTSARVRQDSSPRLAVSDCTDLPLKPEVRFPPLNADSAPCRADNTQTRRIFRSRAAALPLPSNPALLLTVRCHPAHKDSPTPFSQAERRLLSCAKAGTCHQCHTIPHQLPEPSSKSTRPPPTNATSTSSSSTPASLPTPTNPRPPKPHEIRSIHEALNVPNPRKNREAPLSNHLH
jgi:hypothetical protein